MRWRLIQMDKAQHIPHNARCWRLRMFRDEFAEMVAYRRRSDSSHYYEVGYTEFSGRMIIVIGISFTTYVTSACTT